MRTCTARERISFSSRLRGFSPPRTSRPSGLPLVHSAFAAGDPITRYEVYRRHERIGVIPFRPQTSRKPFSFEDSSAPDGHMGGLYYKVRTVDEAGRHVDTATIKA